MDSTIDFLPSPIDKGPVMSNNIKRYPKTSENLCAYAYKIIMD